MGFLMVVQSAVSVTRTLWKERYVADSRCVALVLPPLRLPIVQCADAGCSTAEHLGRNQLDPESHWMSYWQPRAAATIRGSALLRLAGRPTTTGWFVTRT